MPHDSSLLKDLAHLLRSQKYPKEGNTSHVLVLDKTKRQLWE